MKKLILPSGSTYEERTEEEVFAILHMSLLENYKWDAEFRRRSDELHHSRLMSGPACYQCMSMIAMSRQGR